MYIHLLRTLYPQCTKKFPSCLPFRPSRRKFSGGRLVSKQSGGESESSSSDSGNNSGSSGGSNGSNGYDSGIEELSRRTRETTVSSPLSPLKSSDYNPFTGSFGANAAAGGPRGHSVAPVSSTSRYQPLASNYRSTGFSSTSGFPAGVREKVSEGVIDL